VVTTLTLPLLVWLTDVSADASLSVLGIDTLEAYAPDPARPIRGSPTVSEAWGRVRSRFVHPIHATGPCETGGLSLHGLLAHARSPWYGGCLRRTGVSPCLPPPRIP
jgi:hypothetical protein